MYPSHHQMYRLPEQMSLEVMHDTIGHLHLQSWGIKDAYYSRKSLKIWTNDPWKFNHRISWFVTSRDLYIPQKFVRTCVVWRAGINLCCIVDLIKANLHTKYTYIITQFAAEHINYQFMTNKISETGVSQIKIFTCINTTYFSKACFINRYELSSTFLWISCPLVIVFKLNRKWKSIKVNEIVELMIEIN